MASQYPQPADLLREVVSAGRTPGGPRPGPFALLRREGRAHLEVYRGAVSPVRSIAELPIGPEPGPRTLAVVPYRQIRERGFTAIDDQSPLLALAVDRQATVAVDAALTILPSHRPRLRPGAFDVTDAEYTDLVTKVLRDEIGRGEGSNFVLRRGYLAEVVGDPTTAALAVFGRLLRAERGAYWTFCVHTGTRTLVGASPERHVSVEDGLIMMNPISGTFRHSVHREPAAERDRLLRFLADRKEIDELFMVLDEELKMMANVADLGGHVIGPFLKEMTQLTHTEYLLAGSGSRDVREVLRQTMFAPTVVGSPIENACRVIARHEPAGRGYYGGVLALLGTDQRGRQTLDAPILIRYAQFESTGQVVVPVGATLVRDSIPANEVAETEAKARGVLSALGLAPARPAVDGPGFAADPVVQRILAGRNANLAQFWLERRPADDPALAPELLGRSVLVVDGEDSFTGMLLHQMRALGMATELCSYRDVPAGGADSGPDPAVISMLDRFDLVIAGPGPGDPRRPDDPRIAALRRVVLTALGTARPLLGVCLGHQLLSGALGLPLIRKDRPDQGVQRRIDFFGRPELVGFYSTFTATASAPVVPTRFGPVEVSRDRRSGQVHALRGRSFAGVQFHAESVLSQHGVDLLRELVGPLVSAGHRQPDGRPA